MCLRWQVPALNVAAAFSETGCSERGRKSESSERGEQVGKKMPTWTSAQIWILNSPQGLSPVPCRALNETHRVGGYTMMTESTSSDAERQQVVQLSERVLSFRPSQSQKAEKKNCCCCSLVIVLL